MGAWFNHTGEVRKRLHLKGGKMNRRISFNKSIEHCAKCRDLNYVDIDNEYVDCNSDNLRLFEGCLLSDKKREKKIKSLTKV